MIVDLRSDTVTQPTAGHARGDGRAPRSATTSTARIRPSTGSRSASPSCSARRPRCSCRRARWPTRSRSRVHTRPGDEVIVGSGAHCWRYESGAARRARRRADAASSATRRHVHRRRRRAPPSSPTTTTSRRRRCRRRREHAQPRRRRHAGPQRSSPRSSPSWRTSSAWPRTSTARASGTRASPAASLEQRAARRLRHRQRLPVEGARRAGRLAHLRARRRLCIARHRLRKMLGGGMRQAGILAAAGLYALEHHRARLAEDHANARRARRGARAAPGIVRRPAAVETNIVMIDLERGTRRSTRRHSSRARAKGRPARRRRGSRRMRAVTHLDVDRRGRAPPPPRSRPPCCARRESRGDRARASPARLLRRAAAGRLRPRAVAESADPDARALALRSARRALPPRRAAGARRLRAATRCSPRAEGRARGRAPTAIAAWLRDPRARRDDPGTAASAI